MITSPIRRYTLNCNDRLRFSGFTLIELLVTFTLMSIISGIGFAAFANYSRKQTVVQAAQDLRQSVNLSRFNSLASVKPSQCSNYDLSSYKFNFCINSGCGVAYEAVADCGSVTKTIISKTLPPNVTLANIPGENICQSLKFHTLSSIVEGVPCKIKMSGYGNDVIMSIDSSGYVSL